MRKSEMGEIGRTDRARYSAIRRVLGTALEDIDRDRVEFIDSLSESSTEVSSELREYIREGLEALPKREGFILEKRFIFGYTLEEVGQMMNLTRDRIRQIQIRALQRLRWGRHSTKSELSTISNILYDLWETT